MVLNYKWNSFPEGTAVLDLEASKMDSVHYPFWQTDMSMSETWSYSSDGKYKTAEQLIHTLIDIVSKNGTLLLNISPLADGRIPMEEQDRLLEMGAWLQVNGEAIYGTRPFKNYGEGPTQIQFGNGPAIYIQRHPLHDKRENPVCNRDGLARRKSNPSLPVFS